MMNRNTNKKANVKSVTIPSKAFLARFIIIVVVTSPISTNLSFIGIAYAEEEQQLADKYNGDSKINNEKIKQDSKKGVFYTLTSIPSLYGDKTSTTTLSTANKTSNNTVHIVEMVVETLPSGMPAYKMVSHVKINGLSSSVVTNDGNSINLTPKYSSLATIPGPTLVVNEGDHVKVNIKDTDGNTLTNEEFIASKPGTFLYIYDSK
jgi:hypothetical protein